MAVTDGTCREIAPATGVGRQPNTTDMLRIVLAATTVVSKGDIVKATTGVGYGSVVNIDPVAGDILGVAMYDITAGAAVDPENQAGRVEVAMALPGSVFEGSLVGSTTTDHPGAATDLLRKIGLTEATMTSTSDYAHGRCVLDFGDVAALVTRTVGFSSQFSGATGLWYSGIGVTNPRVLFVFTGSAFF